VKKQILAAVLLGVLSAQAMATELTGNAGFVTDYVWRGIDASNGKAAAQGGLDAGWGNGLFVGAWLSTVELAESALVCEVDDPGTPVCDGSIVVKEIEKSGIEIDLYAGWAGETKSGDWNYGVAGTYYTFTDRVAGDFTELNLSGGFKWFSLTINPGKFKPIEGSSEDYIFYSLTGELNGFYATLGYWDWDKSKEITGGYGEVGYGSTLEWDGKELFDYSISYVYADDELLFNDQSPNTLIFGITKNFGILD
jgi:uncharacterized protein (TIGR02001 family)